MNPLENCDLIKDQANTFKEEGHLVLRNVLTQNFIGELIQVLDEIDAKHREWMKRHREWTKIEDRFTRFEIFRENDIFIKLIDQPRIYPLVFELLGKQAQIFTSHLSVYPSEGANPKKTGSDSLHRDGGFINEDMIREKIWPQPMLTLRVIYWLNDISTPEHGALRFIPKSHIIRDVDNSNEKHLLVNAGDVTIHDRRLVHARGYNTSGVTRKAIFLGYSYRWIRFVRDGQPPSEIIDKCNPLQKHLIGETFGKCPHGCD